MIRTIATVNTSPIADLMAFLDSQNAIVQDIGTQVFERNAPQLLDELRFQPPPAKYPIEWASEKQRRYVMAKLRAANNLPYRRTGKLVSGWQVTNASEAGQFTIIIKNESPVAKYVVGTLAKDPAAARLRIQKFHLNTGWLPAVETVNFWLEAMREDFQSEYAALIGEFGATGYKRKGYAR